MKLEDAPQVHRLWTERQMRRRLWNGGDMELGHSFAVIERSVEFFETRGAGLWCAFARDEDLLVGFGGFWFLADLPEPQVTFGVSSSQARHGFATEILCAVLRHGFRDLGFPRVLVDVPDEPTRHLAEKLGFCFDRCHRIDRLLLQYHAVDALSFRDDGSSHRLVPGPQPLLRV